ncbi:MAG: bifunctional protein-serine/threonine kinase/phosphatase, partial [Pseudomonadota bacterium]|nr:bifunctional protein-serine/threonine kinase/phosphatase [Pseudomonadota bacterium]
MNEDAFALHVPQGMALRSKGVTAVSADGVSGAAAARDASRSCVRGFVSDYYATPDSWSVKRSAHRVLSALNRWLHGQGFRAYGTANGLVSTFSAVIV